MQLSVEKEFFLGNNEKLLFLPQSLLGTNYESSVIIKKRAPQKTKNVHLRNEAIYEKHQ